MSKETRIKHQAIASDEIVNELDVLAEKHAEAQNEGRKVDAAFLKLEYDEQFARWRGTQRTQILEGIVALENSLALLKLRMDWWRELSGVQEEPTEVSAAQKAIVVGSDIVPRDWKHAHDAIALISEYRLPSQGNFASWHESYTDIESASRVLLQYFEKAFAQFDVEDANDPSWTKYREQTHSEIKELLRRYDNFWSMAEFSA